MQPSVFFNPLIKQKIFLLGLILLSVNLISCDDRRGSYKKKSNEYCSDSYTVEYNKIWKKIEVESINAKPGPTAVFQEVRMKNLKEMVQDCQKFDQDYGDFSCKALVNYSIQTISRKNFKVQCDQAKIMVIDPQFNSNVGSQDSESNL